jgi:hypothetical protein
MSDDGNGKPPSWDDLVTQVQGALEELNLNSPENQALFVDGLKEVMDSLEGIGFDLGVPPGPKPEMHVFEGGKGDEPTEEKELPVKGKAKKKAARPDLKVAPPEEKATNKPETDKSAPPGFPSMPNLPPFTAFPGNDPESMQALFKVLRLGEDAQGGLTGGSRSLGAQGKILLPEGKDEFQNIFRGDIPRVYRIECTASGLQIYLDGKPAEQVKEGQSTDVEACVIRVQASGESGAAGIYALVAD